MIPQYIENNTNIIPTIVRIPGHNLFGRIFVLKPVNIYTTAIINCINANNQTVKIETTLSKYHKNVITNTMKLLKTRVIPDATYSIAIIILLSKEMSQNPFTTCFIGIKCATSPHNNYNGSNIKKSKLLDTSSRINCDKE